MNYKVTYRNEGRPEQSAVYADKEAAQKTAGLLKSQGATRVRVVATDGMETRAILARMGITHS